MTDFKSLTEEELTTLIQGASDELSRRRFLADAPKRVEAIVRHSLDAEGVQDGQPWQETVLGYPEGFKVTYTLPNGEGEGLWVNLRPGNRYAPGSPGGGWSLQSPDGDTPPLWVKPAWAELGYDTGDLVTYPTYEEGDVYRSLIDNNTWSPVDYPDGWELVGGEDDPTPGDDIPVWVKPVWAGEGGGAYALGDLVHYPDAEGPVYVSTHDGWNTWAPGEYGWELAESS